MSFDLTFSSHVIDAVVRGGRDDEGGNQAVPC
jgi:hypothetical protein